MFSGLKQKTAPPVPPPKVILNARSPYPREDIDSDMSSVDFRNYRVQFPVTPDNHPLSLSVEAINPLVSAKIEEHYVSNSLFSGGFNSVTRAHLMDRITDSDPAKLKSTGCAVKGCDGKSMRDERGEELLPCECEFKICRECFGDAVKNGGICPGCKEPYKATDVEEVARIGRERRAVGLRRLPAPVVEEEDGMMDRRLSVVRSVKGVEFDHNRWLFETKGTYGYGNAIWPEDAAEIDQKGGGGGGGGNEGGAAGEKEAPARDLAGKAWRPLTRKLAVPAAVLSPYR